MANKKVQESLYVCSACKEEYIGSTRKWTCPICGNADTYSLSEGYHEENYNEDNDYSDYN